MHWTCGARVAAGPLLQYVQTHVCGICVSVHACACVWLAARAVHFSNISIEVHLRLLNSNSYNHVAMACLSRLQGVQHPPQPHTRTHAHVQMRPYLPRSRLTLLARQLLSPAGQPVDVEEPVPSLVVLTNVPLHGPQLAHESHAHVWNIVSKSCTYLEYSKQLMHMFGIE
jgi:hypothetical protein